MAALPKSIILIAATVLAGLCLALGFSMDKPPREQAGAAPTVTVRSEVLGTAAAANAPQAQIPTPPPTQPPPTLTPAPTDTPPPKATPVPTNTPLPTATPVPTPAALGSLGGKWNLIFNDEFDTPALDLKSWVTCYYWDNHGCTNGGNHELEWYVSQNVEIGDGALKLIAKQESVHASDGKTYPYTSGMVTTGLGSSHDGDYYRFQFKYGYTEIKARFRSGKGLWPAFWLLPADSSTSKPEIDVLEIIGDAPNIVNMTLHYQTGRGADKEGNTWSGPDLSNDWHTYAVDWQPDHLTWYVDGVERWTYTDARYIPHEPMYLLLNLAVGGDWPGSPDQTTVFPSMFEIDYVRVWAAG